MIAKKASRIRCATSKSAHHTCRFSEPLEDSWTPLRARSRLCERRNEALAPGDSRLVDSTPSTCTKECAAPPRRACELSFRRQRELAHTPAICVQCLRCSRLTAAYRHGADGLRSRCLRRPAIHQSSDICRVRNLERVHRPIRHCSPHHSVERNS